MQGSLDTHVDDAPREAGAPDLLASQIEVYGSLVDRLENKTQAYRKSFDSDPRVPELAPRSPIHAQILTLGSINARLERLIDELDV